MKKRKVYDFTLYKGDGEYLDDTQIDEDSEELAPYLFMEEFGWKDILSQEDLNNAYIMKEESYESEV